MEAAFALRLCSSAIVLEAFPFKVFSDSIQAPYPLRHKRRKGCALAFYFLALVFDFFVLLAGAVVPLV